VNMQGKLKLKVWSLLLLVFVFGGVTGAALDGIYRARSEAGRGRWGGRGGPNGFVEALRDELKLSDEQVVKIRGILEEMRREFPPPKLSECPGFKEMRERTNERLKTVLTPEQQKRFDEFNAQRDARFKNRSPAAR
jgi:hypothetical protein